MCFKRVLFFILLVSFVATTSAQDESATPAVGKAPAEQSSQESESAKVDDEMDEEAVASTIEKASLLIGFNTISRLKQQNAEYDLARMIEGLTAAHEGSEIGMSKEEQRSVLKSYQMYVRNKIKEQRRAEAEKNRVEGENAIAEFAEQEGAKKLEDGVHYIVLTEGDGDIPEAPDSVRVNYVGSYADGEIFDSSFEKGRALERGVLQFVPGFSNVLQNMKVGGKWKVIIRGDKAYGMRPRPPMELNKTLIFEIDLLEIVEPE